MCNFVVIIFFVFQIFTKVGCKTQLSYVNNNNNKIILIQININLQLIKFNIQAKYAFYS